MIPQPPFQDSPAITKKVPGYSCDNEECLVPKPAQVVHTSENHALLCPYSSLGCQPLQVKKCVFLPFVTFVFCRELVIQTEKAMAPPLQYSCLENPMDGGAWLAAVHGVTKSRTRLSDFIFTFHFRSLEREMATHSTVLAWRIPGTGEPGGLPSMGSHRVGHN